jgi:hypothetical protein
MTNEQMKPARYENWAKYRKFVNRVSGYVSKYGKVTVVCGHSQIPFEAKTLQFITATKSGVWVQKGKNKICIMDRAIQPSRIYA